jgi:dihydrolipoamide dehydrogenase
MSHPDSCDVLVLGSGPGGYVAAIRCAQLGFDTVCVERELLGGICLNWGCIPTKALLRSAEILELCHRADEFGIEVEHVSFDFPAIIKRSRKITERINKGVGYLLRKNSIHHVPGFGRLGGAGKVHVQLSDGSGEHTITAKHIIVATGARARSLPGIELDDEHIIEYRRAMTLPERPESLIVIGAGAIGVEFASFYASLGTQVTIVEYMDNLVPNEDHEVSAELEKAFKKRGIDFLLGHKVTSASVDEGRVTVAIEPKDGAGDDGPEFRSADKLLVAVGITGNSENIGLEELGISTNRSFIEVDDEYATNVNGIYAIGDITGGMALAHVASAEGVYVAERLAGMTPPKIDYETIPACTYCHPEIASVGLTEKQAAERGIEVKIGRFPFRPLGKTMAAGEYPGFVKFIWEAERGALVGAHMIGPAVTDLIAEPTLAKSTEVNAESLLYTMHAHPTFAEALKEATEDALGHAIHL